MQSSASCPHQESLPKTKSSEASNPQFIMFIQIEWSVVLQEPPNPWHVWCSHSNKHNKFLCKSRTSTAQGHLRSRGPKHCQWWLHLIASNGMVREQEGVGFSSGIHAPANIQPNPAVECTSARPAQTLQHTTTNFEQFRGWKADLLASNRHAIPWIPKTRWCHQPGLVQSAKNWRPVPSWHYQKWRQGKPWNQETTSKYIDLRIPCT